MRILSPTQIGNLVYYITVGIAKTSKIKYNFHDDFIQDRKYIYVFWHGKQFGPAMFLAGLNTLPHAGLASSSNDGQIVATWLKRMGQEVVRGSSSKNAIGSLKKLVNLVDMGFSVGIALDGPRGPRHKSKIGAGFIANKTNTEIVPVGTAFTKKIAIEQSWDGLQVPLPFGKMSIYMGQPFRINSIKEQPQILDRLNQAVTIAEEHAAKYL